MRSSAWLLSQDCATKTASRPNTTATPIMTMVLVRTTLVPLTARDFCGFVAINIEARQVLNW